MLTYRQKYQLFVTMYEIIAHCRPCGINTRTLVQSTIETLSSTMPPLNSCHAYGMLSYMSRSCGVRFLQKSHGNSVVYVL